MEDLGKTATSRGYMPPMGEVETFKEANAKAETSKQEGISKVKEVKEEGNAKDISSGYVDLGEDAWELE